ncbi:MAG: anthranilate phosphoribosyltransferase [Pseudomonadota bacterium]
MSELKATIAKVAEGATLNRDEARAAFDVLMSGDATPTQIGALLMGLRQRGETVDEIAGAVSSMRARMVPVDAPEGAIDIVGTGGDSSGSYNISTAAALVAAGAGATVAKHGNRALTSKSGAADTLEALGVSLEGGPDVIARCIAEAGVGFMFAPAHHQAMRHVGPSRVELGFRTIFNLLGPLSNPAGAKRQVLGVFAPQWVEPLAHVLNELGAEHVWVVHGDGMDEITVTAETQVAELKDGKVRTFTIVPADAGMPTHSLEALKGGDAAHNAKALTALLDGQPSAYRDMTVFNAAAGLVVAGLADDLQDGATKAASAIDDGKAKAVLTKLVALSQGDGA